MARPYGSIYPHLGSNLFSLASNPNGILSLWLLIIFGGLSSWLDHRLMIIFIITRLLDIITTLLNIQKYGGWEVELNPLVRNIGNNGIYSFVAYQFTIIILAIVLVERFRIKNLVYISFSIISLIAVAINIYCLFL